MNQAKKGQPILTMVETPELRHARWLELLEDVDWYQILEPYQRAYVLRQLEGGEKKYAVSKTHPVYLVFSYALGSKIDRTAT